jgi:alkanesulfonate monooxygenase SsuD/methylene tetrahydromethanopterin reductase-like flavin-dependent oxidoreductase (luciferase family)
MRYRICAASIGEYAEPGRVVEVAEAAEAAGWEALLTWDHLAYAWAGWRRSSPRSVSQTGPATGRRCWMRAWKWSPRCGRASRSGTRAGSTRWTE